MSMQGVCARKQNITRYMDATASRIRGVKSMRKLDVQGVSPDDGPVVALGFKASHLAVV